MEPNQDAVRLVKPYVDKKAGEAASAAANAAVGKLFKGEGDDLPTAADKIGKLFIKTGSTNPGLYVSTGTTTPGWKAVSHAS